jgi:hypothetical protein
MTTEEQKTITNFIGKLANKDYSDAQHALEAAIETKLKNKIRTYINQEEN